jgi:anti-sigma regulatory factor (Ser/Thr protein kinase)
MNTARDSNHAAVTRRTFLGAAVASAALATGSALAQQLAPAPPAPRAKGPVVWLDMDQAELDAAYDQIKYAPNLPQIVKRYATNSDAVRSRLGAPRRYAYGSTPIEALDLYATKRANAPINIFIHGGAWRGGLAKDSAYPAELFVHAGAHYVVPDFINVIEANGSLMPMAEQVRRAVAWVYRNAQSFGGDPNRIYVALDNLLDNAIRFSPIGSTVEINLKAEIATYVVEVVDHGPGVPPNLRAKIFEPFRRIRHPDAEPSTGLGLAIAKAIIEVHQGQIQCEAGAGGTGSRFWFSLPR